MENEMDIVIPVLERGAVRGIGTFFTFHTAVEEAAKEVGGRSSARLSICSVVVPRGTTGQFISSVGQRMGSDFQISTESPEKDAVVMRINRGSNQSALTL